MVGSAEHREASNESSTTQTPLASPVTRPAVLQPPHNVAYGRSSNQAVFHHDVFNLVALGVLNSLHFFYLVKANGFQVFWWATMAYFAVDFAWILLVPTCVKSPTVISTHHVVSALFTLIPFFFPEHNDKMSYVMTVEVNTWLLIARRVMPSPLVSVLFYVSWVAVRNVLFPYLIYDFYLEYLAAFEETGNPWHPVVLAPLLQVGLTLLNFQWTWDLYKSVVRSFSAAVKVASTVGVLDISR